MQLIRRFRFNKNESIQVQTGSSVLDSAIEYEHQIRKTGSYKNPIIVIPGILGSNLIEAQKEKSLWGSFDNSFANPKADKNLRLIALPMERGKTLDQLQGLAKADGSLRYIKGSIAGMAININTYASMLSAMGVGSDSMGGSLKKLDDYIDDNRHEANAFEFDYDWRRSVDENAVRLGKYIQKVTEFVKLQRGNHDPVKFDVVAHSMGGLIARYFLQYGSQLLPAGGGLPTANWSGSAQIERVVLIAPPNAGSLFALQRLLTGIPKNPLTPGYDPVVLGSLPSVYQLLPRIRHKTFLRSDVNEQAATFLDLGLWVDMNWGLANKSKDRILARLLPGVDSLSARRETALEHLEKCLKNTISLHQALDNVALRPSHLQMFLFVGDATVTPLIATARKGDSKLKIVKKGAGDGTVPRSSVLLDERVGGEWAPNVVSPLVWDNIVFLSSNHLGLTKDPICIKNILYFLLESP